MITKEKLRELLLSAYNSGFDDGVGAVELSIEDGEDGPDDSYRDAEDTVDKLINKLGKIQ